MAGVRITPLYRPSHCTATMRGYRTHKLSAATEMKPKSKLVIEILVNYQIFIGIFDKDISPSLFLEKSCQSKSVNLLGYRND